MKAQRLLSETDEKGLAEVERLSSRVVGLTLPCYLFLLKTRMTASRGGPEWEMEALAVGQHMLGEFTFSLFHAVDTDAKRLRAEQAIQPILVNHLPVLAQSDAFLIDDGNLKLYGPTLTVFSPDGKYSLRIMGA